MKVSVGQGYAPRYATIRHARVSVLAKAVPLLGVLASTPSLLELDFSP
jgi:hypothetical protein